MKDYFKYLTSSAEDKKWGLYLTVTGCYTAPPGESYPKKEHPSGYYFEWETGRTLNEYQLIYIASGGGLLQVEKKTFEVNAGHIIILKPNRSHRYKPNTKTGWTEHYLGFSGPMAEHFLNSALEDITEPLVACSNHLELLSIFQKVYDIIEDQKPSYQKICSGLTLSLIGQIESQYKSQQFNGKEVDDLVNQAKKYLWEQVDEEIDLELFSNKQHVSYSYFRKVFKLYTGISPHQYYLDLKIMRAKELLVVTDQPITEIAYKLGFSSIHYFSRLYKQKTGQTPTDLRNQNMRS